MKIKNLVKREIEIVVETKDLLDVFSINLTNYKILPRTEIEITVYFSPMLAGNYVSELPIYDKNQELLEICKLRGESLAELIESDISEIYFLPVPTKVPTKESIILTFVNYKKTPMLKWKFLDQENSTKYFKVFFSPNKNDFGQER